MSNLKQKINKFASDAYDKISNDVEKVKKIIRLPVTNKEDITNLKNRIEYLEKHLNIEHSIEESAKFPVKSGSKKSTTDKSNLVKSDEWVKLDHDVQ